MLSSVTVQESRVVTEILATLNVRPIPLLWIPKTIFSPRPMFRIEVSHEHDDGAPFPPEFQKINCNQTPPLGIHYLIPLNLRLDSSLR